jgi:hypothetical protein
MWSNATLRWLSVIGTALLALASGGIVASTPKPAGAPLHPAIKLLPSDTTIQSQSYVS